ncbi:MAG: Clp protease N-terminal domain-containing protein [Thermomicrobiales bacterium]
MAKVTVDISLTHLDAARRFGIPLSETCQHAIEHEAQKNLLHLMEMNPAGWEVLRRARQEAKQRGQSVVGPEHILLAIISSDDWPAQVMRQLGVTDQVTGEIDTVMRSESYNTGSNRTVDTDGNPIGYMYLNEDGHPYVGDADGNPIRVTPSSPNDERRADQPE